MNQIKASGKSILELGRQGENLARQVVFDLSAWEAEYGPGTVELIHQRPGDTSPYPVAAVREGSTLVWTLTATDTAVASSYVIDGRCELRWYVGETLVKSKTWRTWVESALSTPSETAPPEPEQGWVDQVLAAGAAAMTAADGAKADADRAAALAAEVAEKASQTTKDATAAAQAKEAAMTAQRLAEDAQRAAEAAKQAAETAKEAVAQSATDAEGAKQAAESALKSTQDAAATAAQALSDILALYQEMQTWAQGVVQDVNEAGSHAVQSVQSAGDAQVQRVTDEGTTQTANAKAQADAAALSAAGAAQSAHEAAESAAVYDNVVSDVNQLKQDIVNLNDSKITKFYASSMGESTLSDSDNGKIMNMRIFGYSVQDGTPSPDAPVEIQSVVNPTVRFCGKNVFHAVGGVVRSTGEFKRQDDKQCTAVACEEFIDVGNHKSITVSKAKPIEGGNDGDYTFMIRCYDKSKTLITSVSGVKKTQTFGVRTLPDNTKYIRAVFFADVKGTDAIVETYNPMIQLGDGDTTYAPYTGQSVMLPYTLNAIPVSSGGNVTIDGQQYLADYVDVERKKLVRLTEKAVVLPSYSIITSTVSENVFSFDPAENGYANPKYTTTAIGYECTSNKFLSSNTKNSWDEPKNTVKQASFSGKTQIVFISSVTDVSSFKAILSASETYVIYQLETPIEIDLTGEEVQAFRGLVAYYPVTNVTVASDQLDGYTTFDYPISMENGWNHIKQQLGDTREYIYDMDVQSALAYVNSEYAVALAELEV